MPAAQQDHSRWSQYYQANKDFSLITRETLSFVLNKANLQRKRFAVDLGSGTGQLTRELFHRGFQRITGVDISDVAVQLAQESTVFPELKYIEYNLEEDFERLFSEKADFIITKYVLAFIDDCPSFLERVKKILSEEASFIIISPSLKYQPEKKHDITIDSKVTQELLKDHFRTVKYFEYARDDIFVCKN